MMESIIFSGHPLASFNKPTPNGILISTRAVDQLDRPVELGSSIFFSLEERREESVGGRV